MAETEVDLHLVEIEEFIIGQLEEAFAKLRAAVGREADFPEALMTLNGLWDTHEAAIEGADAARTCSARRGDEA